MELSRSGGPWPRPARGAGRVVAGALLWLWGAGALAGCAAGGLSRAEIDAEAYAGCVRSGGIWYGDQQFGGSCQFRGPSR